MTNNIELIFIKYWAIETELITIWFDILVDFINKGNKSIKLENEQYTRREINVIMGWIGINNEDTNLFLYKQSLNKILLKLLIPIAKKK